MLFNFIGQQGLLTSGNHLTKRFQDHYKAFSGPLQSVFRTITKRFQDHYKAFVEPLQSICRMITKRL